MIEKLSGTGVALVTPFRRDGSVDYNGLEKLLEHTSRHGVDYFVVMGTTGEPATLSPEERSDILNFVKLNNTEGLPIVYGIGGNSTESVVNEISSLDLDGVDAILSVSPYYNKPSQAGIIKHYERLADHSPKPLILYNVPGRTASNMEAETTLSLARHHNIIGIKDASGDFNQLLKIAADKPEEFLLISGDDMLTLPIFSIGGEGVISVLANAYPEVFRSIIKNFTQGDIKTAAIEAQRLCDIHPLMYVEGSPSGVKYVLSELNICGPTVRLPMAELSDEVKNRIRQVMKAM
jgi:4-hydroxy-tetrahydrodipicolinate synthase